MIFNFKEQYTPWLKIKYSATDSGQTLILFPAFTIGMASWLAVLE
jgi:hypothetical protein